MQSKQIAKTISLMLLTVFLLPTHALAEKILRYSDHEPLGGMRTKFIKEVFFTAIEKESKGRLKIDAHWGAELSSGYDALTTVGQGRVADMATVVPEYTADNLPLHQLFKSFPTGPSGAKQISFFRNVYAELPDFSAELAKNEVVPVLLSTGYPVAFFSTHPFSNLTEIKNQKWRSASFWHLDFLQNASAIPVNMHWGEEIYKALEAKTLDGIMVNVDSGYMLNLHKTAPNILVSPNLWLGHLYIVTINRQTWNELAAEDKAAIQRAAETSYKKLGSLMDQSFDIMIDDLKKSGAKVRLLNDKEVDAWKSATNYKQVQSTWVKEQAAKGVKNASSVLEKVSTLMSF